MKQTYLFIDTADHAAVKIQYGSFRGQAKVNREQHSSRVLLRLIQQSLKKAKHQYKNISGVAVVAGPGPFTSLRVGVATANTLGFVLGVPVVGIRRTAAATFAQFITVAKKKLATQKKFTPVTPYYGRPPHITKRKKR